MASTWWLREQDQRDWDRRNKAAAEKPCPDCGRSRARFLTLGEAFALFGYAKVDCVECGLTHHKRDQDAK